MILVNEVIDPMLVEEQIKQCEDIQLMAVKI